MNGRHERFKAGGCYRGEKVIWKWPHLQGDGNEECEKKTVAFTWEHGLGSNVLGNHVWHWANERKSRKERDYVGILLISGHEFHKAPRGFGFRRLGEVVKEFSRDTQNCVGIRFWGPQVVAWKTWISPQSWLFQGWENGFSRNLTTIKKKEQLKIL